MSRSKPTQGKQREGYAAPSPASQIMGLLKANHTYLEQKHPQDWAAILHTEDQILLAEQQIRQHLNGAV